MTGAPIPAGADSVIRVEDTDGGEHIVVVRDARDVRRNIRPRGEDLQVGSLAVPRGIVLGPAHIGVLASVGCDVVPVRRRPRVAVLASGDELVDLDEFERVRRGERIVSSNSYTLAAAARAAGADVARARHRRGRSPDEYERRIARAAGCDLLITSGGVSVGAFDFTKDVLRRLGAELQLWRVRMRPGAPLGFGMLGAHALAGAAGQSRVGDGHLRAVRPAVDPEAVGRGGRVSRHGAMCGCWKSFRSLRRSPISCAASSGGSPTGHRHA